VRTSQAHDLIVESTFARSVKRCIFAREEMVMLKGCLLVGCSLLVSACGSADKCARVEAPENTAVQSSSAPALVDPNPAPATLKVELVTDGGKVMPDNVFAGFGCTGKNTSLGVSWSGAPDKAQSYALIMHDPDAPTGVGFFHWTVFNLPKDTKSLAAGARGSLPAGAVEAYTDFGKNGYGGPCPPPGPLHHYVVTVYALDVPKLDAPPAATGALLSFMLREHTVALGRATATYGR